MAAARLAEEAELSSKSAAATDKDCPQLTSKTTAMPVCTIVPPATS